MGFGSGTREFWYGVQAIHCLTNPEVRTDFTFSNGTKGYLSYSNFRVGPVTEQYPLAILGYDGVTPDPLYINPSHQQWSLDQMNFYNKG